MWNFDSSKQLIKLLQHSYMLGFSIILSDNITDMFIFDMLSSKFLIRSEANAYLRGHPSVCSSLGLLGSVIKIVGTTKIRYLREETIIHNVQYIVFTLLRVTLHLAVRLNFIAA